MEKPKVNHWFLVEHYAGAVVKHIYIARSKQAVLNSLGPLQKRAKIQTMTWRQVELLLDARTPINAQPYAPAAGRVLFRINKHNVTIGGLY